MQTSAFILSSEPRNEYDRNYALLARDLGVIEAFTRSVRKAGSKLSGHLEPPNNSWVELIESQRGWQITSALEINPHRKILASPAALRVILQAGWLVTEFVPISHPDEELWELWSQFVKELSYHSGGGAAALQGIFAQFLIKLTHMLGFFPEPADIAARDKHLQRTLIHIINGEWLQGDLIRDPQLWEIAKSATKTVKRLM